jgi:hypothetical protein
MHMPTSVQCRLRAQECVYAAHAEDTPEKEKNLRLANNWQLLADIAATNAALQTGGWVLLSTLLAFATCCTISVFIPIHPWQKARNRWQIAADLPTILLACASKLLVFLLLAWRDEWQNFGHMPHL